MKCSKCGKDAGKTPFFVGLAMVGRVVLCDTSQPVLCSSCEEQFILKVGPKLQQVIKKWLG